MADIPNAFVLANLVGITYRTDGNQPEKLPKDYPNHPIIGRYFINGGGAIYYCDSYDPTYGFWMTPAREGDKGWFGNKPPERTNVSERAIGATYHHIWRDEHNGRVGFHTTLINASINGFTFETEPHIENLGPYERITA